MPQVGRPGLQTFLFLPHAVYAVFAISAGNVAQYSCTLCLFL